MALPDSIAPDRGVCNDLPAILVRLDDRVVGNIFSGGCTPGGLLCVRYFDGEIFLKSRNIREQTSHPDKRIVDHDKI